ncbi:MAG: 3-isopropylmalate dehydratase [Deltaproteobacteria bacterium]|nr:MAG: 3-isopropylmalate dehydratase [Deltaproteobacteria bacterium]
MTITGPVYVLGDNIDTDQIIPAEYLNLVPTIPEEYRRLGSYALAGLPLQSGAPTFVPPGGTTTPYAILVAGKNFGCGSSREHAPIALGAAGAKAVVAESFARIFFRNCVATGELYPVETTERIVDAFRTGDEAVLDLEAATLTHRRTGTVCRLRPLGDAGPVIAAGGLFAYARQTGMIAAPPPESRVVDSGPAAGPDD